MRANLDRRLGLPILAYPAASLLGRSVSEILSSAESQAEAAVAVAKRIRAGAAFCFMDLSVEAEAFGARVKFGKDSIPVVAANCLEGPKDIIALKVPCVGAARTGIYLKGASIASKRILDRPVYACLCGPYSAAWQMLGARNIRKVCLENSKILELLLEKISEFLVEYIRAYKREGVSGVLLAEPIAGFLPPELNWKFSGKYVKKIVELVQSSDFSIIYHTCADRAEDFAGQIFKTQACAFHFGEASNMEKIISIAPKDVMIMGNLRALDFADKTPEYIEQASLGLLEKFGKFENYAISSGCDIPKDASWENIDAFCNTVRLFYK